MCVELGVPCLEARTLHGGRAILVLAGEPPDGRRDRSQVHAGLEDQVHTPAPRTLPSSEFS